MAEKEFEKGMLVRRIRGRDLGVGTVVLVRDANGDVHVDFTRSGIGVFAPEELEIVDDVPHGEPRPQ